MRDQSFNGGRTVAGVGDSGPLLRTALNDPHSQLVVILLGADPSPEERITLHKTARHAIATPKAFGVGLNRSEACRGSLCQSR